jgi:hypothetical protein
MWPDSERGMPPKRHHCDQYNKYMLIPSGAATCSLAAWLHLKCLKLHKCNLVVMIALLVVNASPQQLFLQVNATNYVFQPTYSSPLWWGGQRVMLFTQHISDGSSFWIALLKLIPKIKITSKWESRTKLEYIEHQARHMFGLSTLLD